jgi:hypothetical protein
MTWLLDGWHWAWIIATLTAVAVACTLLALDNHRHNAALLERQLDAQDTDLDLTEIHHETMRDLRAQDGPAGGEDDQPADGEPVPLDLPGPLAPAAPLTPKQRRRAVHKGRIPRDLPALASTPAPGGGENHERLIGGVLAAELETGRLLATMRDEARQAEAAAVWAEIGGLVDDAYRWWAAPGRWELAA